MGGLYRRIKRGGDGDRAADLLAGTEPRTELLYDSGASEEVQRYDFVRNNPKVVSAVEQLQTNFFPK